MINAIGIYIGQFLNYDSTPPTGDWILATGFWDDSGIWDDSAFWID